MIPIEQRFWSKVEIRGLDECWEWTASYFPNGYGQWGWGRDNQLSQYAHRSAWILTRGILIPKDMNILHACDNRRCCNPTHLFLGTHRDNVDDMLSKGRQSRGTTHGRSKLTESDVLEIRDSKVRMVDIAGKYGITPSMGWRIKRLKSWGHL